MTTCAFVPCAEVVSCPLPGGCVQQRFGAAPVRMPKTLREAEGLKASAPMEVGTQPRASRDPRFIKRRRKALR